MPMYEYRCGECGKESEMLVFASEVGKERCPHCGSAAMERLLSAFAVGSSEPAMPDSPCAQAGAGGCPGGVCPFAQ